MPESPPASSPNLDFLRKHGKPGCVGLVGGAARIDRAIRRSEARITRDGKPSLWSHAFIFQGARIDGRQWVLESDFDVRLGQIRNGVQENRIEKYADERRYPHLAVLDFGLGPTQTRELLASGLDFISEGTRYAVGGVLKMYFALLTRRLKEAKERDSTFCSSMVRALYGHVGIDLVPDVAIRRTTPEHLYQTQAPHRRYELIRL